MTDTSIIDALSQAGPCPVCRTGLLYPTAHYDEGQSYRCLQCEHRESREHPAADTHDQAAGDTGAQQQGVN